MGQGQGSSNDIPEPPQLWLFQRLWTIRAPNPGLNMNRTPLPHGMGYVCAVISPDYNSPENTSGFGLSFYSVLKIYLPFLGAYRELQV